MIKPGKKNANWEIELVDAKARRRYGLKIVPNSLQIGTVSQDDTVYVRNVGKRVGDFDEQRNWKLGRGAENLSENADAFWDGTVWSLTEGHIHQGLQWVHGRGLRDENLYMPNRLIEDVTFQPLLGDTLYTANTFTNDNGYNMDKAYLWVRRRGSPGTLTFRLMSDSSGSPNAALQTVTKTVTDITDYVSVYQVFDWTGLEEPSAAPTTYWVSVHGASTDDVDNHWEVLVNADVAEGKVSGDGSTWGNSAFTLYYRVTDTDVDRRWFSFFLSNAWYIVDHKDDGTTASKMYINGDRGKATSATATTLTDTARAWTADRWIGALVKITAGTGIGQIREITDNTTTALTVATWDTTPDNTSEFVIYATEWFTQITFSGGTPTLGVVTAPPVVVNNVAYIPQGSGSTVFLHMRWNSTTKAHNGHSETSTGTKGKADLFYVENDGADGPVIWRANNTDGTGTGGAGTVSRANLLSGSAFIAWDTNLTFKDPIFTGVANFDIKNISSKDNQIFVFREDGLGSITNNRYVNINTGMNQTPDPANGVTAFTHGQFTYYSWLNSVVRMYGSTHDDIGDDYRGIGLPDGREGEYADADAYLKLVLFAVDAGTSGISSVLAWDGMGWHELLRGRQAGDRIRMVKVQPCPGTNNRIWTNVGGDMVFQEMPYKKSSPRLESSVHYMHEAVFESAAIDMGTASGLPKFINELAVTVRNLNTNGREIFVDYQVDDDVHTTTWTYAGMLTRSPESVLFMGLENIRRFAYRLRICSNDNTVPVDIEGVVPSGYARTPFKMYFSFQVQAGGIFSRKGRTATAGEMMRWLIDESRQPGRVRMDSVFTLAHGWNVVIHPPRIFPLVAQRGRNP